MHGGGGGRKPEVNMSQQGRGTGGIQVSVHNGCSPLLIGLSEVSKCFHVKPTKRDELKSF